LDNNNYSVSWVIKDDSDCDITIYISINKKIYDVFKNHCTDEDLVVIKGKYKSGDVYFVDFYTDPNTNYKIILLSLTLDGLTKYQNIKTSKRKCLSIKDDDFKIYNICPSCQQEYNTPPAISRRDNKTYICSNCGTKEALFDFIKKEV
jgi:predicted RNA-binding Zn-ribbon protein involved in translation (DUF1610 family)